MGVQALALLATLNAACDSVDRIGEATIEAFRKHPDHEVITSFPSLGEISGALLLAEVGDDRDRFADARALKAYAGSAPVTRASGRSHVVTHRRIKNDRLATVGYGWAFMAMTNSPAAKAHYQRRKALGDRHAAALRNLFNKMLGTNVWPSHTISVLVSCGRGHARASVTGMGDHAAIDTLPAEVSALRVHGTIRPAGAEALVCPSCGDAEGFLLLARGELAVAACRCGTVCRHPLIIEPYVTSQFTGDRRRFVAADRGDADWPDERGDLFTEHPQAPLIVADMPTAYAQAQEAATTAGTV